jgi:hypothetical protein
LSAKKIEKRRTRWDNPTMTVIADNKKRVVLAQAKPGDRFDVQVSATGYLLRKLEPVQSKAAKVRFVKRDGYTVAMGDQPINEEALREALADFP